MAPAFRAQGPDGSRGLGGGRCLRIATGRSAQEGTEKRRAVSTGWEDRPGLPSARGGGDSWRGLGRCWRKCLPVCPSPAAAAQGPCGNSSHRPARTRHQKLAGRRALSSCISGGPDAAVGRNRAPPGLGRLWPSLREAPRRQEALSSDSPALPSTHHPVACAWPPSRVEPLPFLGAAPHATVTAEGARRG